MSYDCCIVHEDESPYMIAIAPQGGTRKMYPETPTEAWFNITYNYSKHIYRVLNGGIPGLDGRCVDETIEPIRKAIEKLGDDTDPDYWQPTEGNAKIALQGLVAMAVQCPGGIWRIL